MKRAKAQNKFLTTFFAIMAYLGWDAGQRWQTERGVVGGWGYIQDPNDTNDPMEREEITRKAQHYERNNWITNRLIDVFELFVTGAGGMPVTPASSDEEWNSRRKELWDLWVKNPDLTSLQDFGTLQSLIDRRWFVDGEVFIYKTRSDRAPFRPRIQLIEASRVKNPPNTGNAKIIDGIEVDSRGRPIAYWVCDGDEYGNEKFRRIPAENIRHIAEPMRPGQLRAFSFLAPVLNDIQDLNELCKMAMLKAKDAAEISNVLENEAGEIPPSEARRQARFNVDTKTAAGTDITKERVQQLRQVLGPRTIALRIGEKISQLRAESPNQIEQAHWDSIVSRICAGVGISKLLVLPWSMQGTVVRGDLDISNTFFRSRSAVIASAILDIYEYVTEEESKFERSIADKPFDWRKASIRAPRGCNVDVGRNSAAMIAELEAGATTYEAIFAPLGLDWKEQFRQRAREEAFLDRVASEEGTTPERIKKSIGDLLRDKMEAESKAREEEDKIAA
jgi:capsid protein